MSTFGYACMVIAFAATVLSVILFAFSLKGATKLGGGGKKNVISAPMSRMQLIGIVSVWLSALVLTICIGILLVAFLGTDDSLYYVAMQRSDSSSSLAILFKISGIWAGREGSLLFWAWLISLVNALVAYFAWRRFNKQKDASLATSSNKAASEEDAAPKNIKQVSSPQLFALDRAALLVSQIVLALFMAILVFDPGNNPFAATPADMLDASGHLTGAAALSSMNALLEHWAMAIHPPTLFVGYAGMTIPFAYAIAALIINDASKAWVERSSRYAMVSWLLLGIGIGLGAVWAYVCLGWGGYWGWDPVENASLLPWLVSVALLHSMTMYRQRGTFKGWTIMCACLVFAFVVLSTFITRSGIVASVHSFQANQVSLILFLILVGASLIAGIVGLILRRDTFFGSSNESDEAESLLSRDVFYYLNNVVMVVCAFFLLYMTLSSALPSWLPFGGQVLEPSTYNAIARPIGIIYCLILAVGPLLGWSKTKGKEFLKQAWLPGIFALALFALLCVYFVTTLVPAYMLTLGFDSPNVDDYTSAGPFWYYALLTLLGFLAASLLIFNALFMIVRALKKRNFRVQLLGGSLAHLSLGLIVIGLIGSSMYVYERSGYMEYPDNSSDTPAVITVRDYELTYVDHEIETMENGDIFYSVTFDVTKNGNDLGQINPSMQVANGTQQTIPQSAVLSLPTEDLFVSYEHVETYNSLYLEVKINPLISVMWLGFVLMMVGTAIAAFGRRK